MSDAQAQKALAFLQVQANGPAWMTDFLERVENICDSRPGYMLTGEELRTALKADGLAAPHHPNAWGAAIAAARRRGLLKETGRWIAMRGPKSHARRTPQYVLVGK